MKQKRIDKEKLVHSILWEILENEGGHTDLTSIWSKYLPRISEINLEYGVDLSQVDWKSVLQKFTYDRKTKEYHLPTTLQPLPKPEDVLKGVKVVKVKVERKDEIHFLKEELNRVRKERDYFLRKNRETDFFSKSSKDFLEVWGTTPQQIQDDLVNYPQHLSEFPKQLRPAYFELLIMKAISCFLQLPLYPEDVLNKDFKKENAVVWRGKIDNLGKPTSWALGGGPDAIAYAHGFHLLVEASLTSGLSQWSREFGPNIRHLIEYTEINRMPDEDVYMLFVAPDIAVDTFRSLKETSRKGKNTIPLLSFQVVDIVETARVVIGLPHVEIRRLLDELSIKLNESQNLGFYKESASSIIQRWRTENMSVQKDFFLALKSYSALISQKKGFARVSEIEEQLRKDSEVQRFFEIINDKFDKEKIAAVLLSNGLAQRIGIIGRDMLLRAIPIIEFKSKTFKMLSAFEKLAT